MFVALTVYFGTVSGGGGGGVRFLRYTAGKKVILHVCS